MAENDPEDLTGKPHLYRGLSDLPSAHNDPPASVVGPTGMREEADSGKGADATGGPSQQPARASRPSREELSHDTVRPRARGGGGAKLLLGAGALLGAFIAFLILKFGLGAGSGHGGQSPAVGGASPNPPDVALTEPATSPAASPTTSDVATTAPAVPLHLTVVDETYHVGSADGRQLSLDEAVSLARSAKPGTPVTIDSIDSSRQGAKDRLRSALEQQQIPIVWTRDGKPETGDILGPGKVVTPGDSGGNK